MNTIVIISAWVVFVLSVIGILAMPFLIGKKRESYDGYSALASFITGAAAIILVGRCLGWW